MKNKLFKEETLDKKQGLNCTKCKQISDWSIVKEIIKLPKYCIFLMNRIDFIRSRKIDKFIEYPDELALNDKFNPKMQYKLSSVIIHQGRLSQGHYTTVVKKKGKWYNCNDLKVTEIQESEAFSKKAYILFYKRINC